ncbi:MAG: hypothetical protein P8X73_01005 [Ignavibacteriaceae bacterium]
MKTLSYLTVILTVVMLSSVSCGEKWNSKAMDDGSWLKEFNLADRTLVPTGRNEYFILEPGFQVVLEGKNVKLIIIALDETKEVAGVTTRVVEEREWISGQLYEVARNFFAIDEKTKDVFYFGEEVDFYKNGKVVGHRGSWLAGVDGATPGLQMPGKVELGMKYYQEVAPEKAMDRAEIIDIDHELKTPAGTFTKCVKMKEGSALKLWEKEFKSYAAGIGLIQDQNLLLTNYGFVNQNK